MKIHITGNSGSGKTTLAAKLGQRLNLPVFGLDKIVWQPGWTQTKKSVRRAKELELAKRPDWIVEGVSKIVRNSADVIVFLDVDRLTSVKRSMLRNVRFLFRGRPEMPENCPEILAFGRQIGIIWQFRDHTRPSILADIEQHQGPVIVECNSVNVDDLSSKIVAALS